MIKVHVTAEFIQAAVEKRVLMKKFSADSAVDSLKSLVQRYDRQIHSDSLPVMKLLIRILISTNKMVNKT